MRIRNGRVIGLGDAVGKQLALVFTHLRIGNVVSLVVIAAGDCRHIAFRHGFRAEDGRIEHTIDNAQYDQCTGDDAADQDRLLSFWGRVAFLHPVERLASECRPEIVAWEEPKPLTAALVEPKRLALGLAWLALEQRASLA